MSVTQPLPFIATARGFLDKYGPSNRYDMATLLPVVNKPILYVLPKLAVQQSLGFSGLPAILPTLTQTQPNLSISEVESANVNFTGIEVFTTEISLRWTNRVLGI